MTRNKKIAKGLGAGALAIATLASGLSFGAASATAAPTDTPFAESKKLIFSDGINYFAAANDASWLQYTSYATLDSAQVSPLDLKFMDDGQRLQSASGRSCLTAQKTSGHSDPYFLSMGSCEPDAHNSWKLSAGLLENSTLGFVSRSSTAEYLTFTTDAAKALEVAEAPGFLDAEVSSIDVNGRSAVLHGRGQSEAFVTMSWGDADAAEVQVGGNGEWTYELERLKLGTNPVHLEQFVDQKKIGEFDLDVELQIADLTVEHQFGAELDDLVTLSGKAQPGAIVQAIDADGKVIVASEKVPASGEWQTKLPAPNKGGVYGFDVVQSYGGEQTGKTPVSVDYGKQLVVTRPTDGFEHPGGALRVAGTGEPGSSISVAEGRRPIGSATVFQSSQWSLNTSDLNAAEHTLTVTQQSKGGNTQTDTITINPGESSVPAPEAEVVFDADVTKKATITGTAEPGATVVIRDAANAQVAKLENVDGTFVADLTAPGAGSHDYTVTQMVDFETSESTKVTADFGAGVGITSPQQQVAPGTVEVTGTTQAGAKVTVAAAGKTVPATVTGATWSAEIEIAPSATPVQITATQTSKGALTTTDTTTVTTDGQQQLRPIAITGPSTYTNGVNARVHGTASPYAKITLATQFGATTATATAKADGSWELWRGFGPDVSYTLNATQTLTDGQTSTSAAYQLNPEGADQSAGVAITGPADGRFDPTSGNTVTGTSAPNATIRLLAPWGQLDTATANGSGKWEINRGFGNLVYVLTAEQTRTDGSKSVSPEFTITPEASQTSPVTITGPNDGYNYPGATTVTGIASPGAEVTISSQWDELRTVTADQDGNWAFDRGFGPAVQYKLTAVQTRTDGTTTTSPIFTLDPKITK